VKRVDLSGSGGAAPVLMAADVPVSFSLPSAIAGEADTNGLCTVQLLRVLSDAHVNVTTEVAAARRAVPVGDELPVVSHHTPHAALQKLLLHDVTRDLPPLLSAYRRADDQSSSNTPKGSVEAVTSVMDAVAQHASGPFDLEEMESALQALMCRAAPLSIHVTHFVYAGELQGSGSLGRLQRSVPQRKLPARLLEAIIDEVDTQERLRALLDLIERAIGYLAALGPSVQASERAERSLHEYALESLLLSAADWQRAATPTVEQHVELCHLQALLIALEAGSASETLMVSPKYCEPLPADVESVLKSDATLIVEDLLPVVHDFLKSQLLEGSWPPEASLKDFLTYSTEADVEQWPWFRDAFPSTLELRHAYALYELLRDRQ